MKRKSASYKELKGILPIDSEVYEFKKFLRYILIVKKSKIIGGSSITPQKLQELKEWLIKNDLQMFMLEMENNDLTILELKADK